jgi:uncharacterized protein (DUF1330 family)
VPAYMIVQMTITDAAQYRKYGEAVVPLITKHGGKQIVRRAKIELLEGHHDESTMAVFEFPSLEAIHAFWNSPEYVPVKELRRGAAALNVWAVEGV